MRRGVDADHAMHIGREPNIQGAGTYLYEYGRNANGWRFAAWRIAFFYMGVREDWPATPPPLEEGT